MRIALIGEFSLLHNYLKEGLVNKGHDVTLFSNGDGWKKMPSDCKLYRTGSKGIKKIYDFYIEPFCRFKKIKGYDIVQLISPLVFSSFINNKIIRALKKNNKHLVLMAAGNDYATVTAYKEGVLKHIFDYDKEHLIKYDEKTLKGRLKIRDEKEVLELVDLVIPTSYIYKVGYKNNPKVSNVIPLPISLTKVEYIQNKVMDKIVFFHGLNRELAKGTFFIRGAMEKLKENYPDDVEIIIDGHLPYDEYIKIIGKTNVILDQCCDYDYGMNACVSMARGKIVMCCSTKEALNEIGQESSPVIPISANIDDIYEKLISIVNKKNEIENMGFQSRKYVEKVHDCNIIAEKYLEAWGRL